MKTEPVQDYILKSEHNLHIAAAVGEAWPDAREKLVSSFFDRLDTRLKRKLKGFEFHRNGRFFVDAYPGCVFRANRPPNPEQSGRVIRAKAAGGRSEATLEFFS